MSLFWTKKEKISTYLSTLFVMLSYQTRFECERQVSGVEARGTDKEILFSTWGDFCKWYYDGDSEDFLMSDKHTSHQITNIKRSHIIGFCVTTTKDLQ